jgi:hypothetical protein
MRTIATGLVFLLIAWFPYWVTPWVDPAWFNQLIGLSNEEAIVVGIIFIVGLYVGQLDERLDRLARAHDKLADRVEELELRASPSSLGRGGGTGTEGQARLDLQYL